MRSLLRPLFPLLLPKATVVIAMIVGVNFDGKIAGVRVTEHRETPGLGDKVDLRKVIGYLALMANLSLIHKQKGGM